MPCILDMKIYYVTVIQYIQYTQLLYYLIINYNNCVFLYCCYSMRNIQF